METDSDETVAIVQKVILEGRHGPYAVAEADGLLITFSLNSPVWEEKRHPERGSVVILSEITKKRAGWRADRGRFYRPSDEKKTRTEQRRIE